MATVSDRRKTGKALNFMAALRITRVALRIVTLPAFTEV
jgi:hypothetical protein